MNPKTKGGPTKVLGEVFTPVSWAKFAVARAGLVDQWLSGKTILDPTLGSGNLLAALVESAIEAGHPLSKLPFSNLWGIEISPVHHAEAVRRFRQDYGVAMEPNFWCQDLFQDPVPGTPGPSLLRCDVLLGNPPWLTFADLPDEVKPQYKQRFRRYGLVPDAQKLLLGGSRVDVAALIVQKTILENLTDDGWAWFFLPLSLFLNDGAHRGFRGFQTGGVPFGPQELYDFQDAGVFPSVATRYALVAFQRNRRVLFPVRYWQWDAGQWRRKEAQPAFEPTGPWSVAVPGESEPWGTLGKICIEAPSLPRQGINTGGANGVFFFDQYQEVDQGVCRVGSRSTSVLLPRAWVHPVVTRRQFQDAGAPPERWVLVPHDHRGKPLGPGSLEDEPLLKAYLEGHRITLEGRKGALLEGWRRRGCWWALLGVGPYCFSPFKILWEAYGKHTFRPLLLAGDWQANQALQAYIPCWSEAEAQRILVQLQEPAVEAYLRSLNMGGTMNWAQPGKIRRLLTVGTA